MLKFLVKTALYSAAPQAFVRIRSARAQRGTRYEKVAAAPEWNASGELTSRRYDSYADYIKHQAEKYTLLLARDGGLDRRALLAYRIKFFRRFRPLLTELPHDAKIVCAGARDGTEVEVWRELGFPQAVGFDLNPGPDNPFVLPGDFNHLPLDDESVDVYYSNAVDHAFDLDLMFKEAHRVLRKSGVALFDIGACRSERYEAVSWERPEIVVMKLLGHFDQLMTVKQARNWMFVTLRKF